MDRILRPPPSPPLTEAEEIGAYKAQLERLDEAFCEWENYKRRLQVEGYASNIAGQLSWHSLGLGMCVRLVKGAKSVQILTGSGQCYDGFVIVRTMAEMVIDMCYIATEPSHADRDNLAHKYVLFDNVQRMHLINKFELESEPAARAFEEGEKAWRDKHQADGNRVRPNGKWHGMTVQDAISSVERRAEVATLERSVELLRFGKGFAKHNSLLWGQYSKFVHGEMMALGRLHEQPSSSFKWQEGPDRIDPAHCLECAISSMCDGILIYSMSSPAPVAPPRMPLI